MKHFSENTSGGKIRTARGFYIAVAICILALAGIATVTFRNATPQVDQNDDTMATETTTVKITAATTAKQVVIPATGVPDTRTTVSTKPNDPVMTTTELNENLFIFPASNVVLQRYSDTLIYWETLGEWRTHNGVDFAAETDSEVHATASGTVSCISEDSVWGYMVEIDHGNRVITRCYGVKPSVQEGASVKLGDVLGTVAPIPAEAVGESHVHFELLVNGRYQDPLTLLRGETVYRTAAVTESTETMPE